MPAKDMIGMIRLPSIIYFFICLFDETNGSLAYDAWKWASWQGLIRPNGWVEKSEVVSLDGNNDGLVFEKVASLDRPDAFSITFWFKRNNQMIGIPTNHQIDNLMVAQSSSYDNDNLEIGSEGSEIEVYLDSGAGGQDARYATSGANISDGTWHHLCGDLW